MSAVTQPPLPPPEVVAPGAAATALKARGLRRPVVPTDDQRSTPAFLRQWNVILLVLVAAFAVVGSIAALVTRSASERTADNTAPALIGVQDLFASVAEANTAATAAFLTVSATGEDDRVNRNLYQDAIRRAAGQTEEVSAIIGPDETAHDALKRIGVALNTYSGQIEAARVANRNDLPNADAELRDGLIVVRDDIGAAVQTVTDQGQRQLDEERGTGRLLAIVAVALGVVTLVALVRLQLGLLQRTNRIINPLLVLATVLIAVVVGYLTVGPLARDRALSEASSGGYDAIATTSQIQTAAFDLQAQLSLKILDGGGADLGASFDEVSNRIERLIVGADSAREEAAAETLRIRWERYEVSAREIEAAVDRGAVDEAVTGFQGEGLSSFNGLNTAVESVLSDNRSQFSSGVERAASAVGTTPFLTVILPVLAALAILLAIQRRLGEYR